MDICGLWRNFWNLQSQIFNTFVHCVSINKNFILDEDSIFSNFGAYFHRLKGNVENILFDNYIIKIHEDKGFQPLIAITPSFLIFPNNLILLQMAPMTPLHYPNSLVMFLHDHHPFFLHLLFNHHLVKRQYLNFVINLKFANYLISIF